jgi:hypothetical protein
MKTLTIKRDMIDSLDSDESKLAFANSLIALFSDPTKETTPAPIHFPQRRT